MSTNHKPRELQCTRSENWGTKRGERLRRHLDKRSSSKCSLISKAKPLSSRSRRAISLRRCSEQVSFMAFIASSFVPLNIRDRTVRAFKHVIPKPKPEPQNEAGEQADCGQSHGFRPIIHDGVGRVTRAETWASYPLSSPVEGDQACRLRRVLDTMIIHRKCFRRYKPYGLGRLVYDRELPTEAGHSKCKGTPRTGLLCGALAGVGRAVGDRARPSPG
jgi:hypothetical protein